LIRETASDFVCVFCGLHRSTADTSDARHLDSFRRHVSEVLRRNYSAVKGSYPRVQIPSESLC